MASSIVGIYHNPTIDNVSMFEDLKYNLLSVSKLCEKDNEVTFDSYVGL